MQDGPPQATRQERADWSVKMIATSTEEFESDDSEIGVRDSCVKPSHESAIDENSIDQMPG